MPKISAYPVMTTPSNDDLFDVSQIQIDGTYISKALSFSDLVTAIGGGGGGTNIYSDDGTLDEDREMDMDAFTLTFLRCGGIGVGATPKSDIIFDATIITDKTIGLPNGTTATRPNPATSGTIWFNSTTSQFEGFNGSNWVILG